jgi:hypothetical protein
MLMTILPPRVRSTANDIELDDQLSLWLGAARKAEFGNVKLTLEQRLTDELAFAQRAEEAGNFGAAGGARDRINKLLGFYGDRPEQHASDSDPMNLLHEMSKLSPAVAELLAKEHGIPWPLEPESKTEH